jgi:type II secretory pathway component HofQ
MPPISRPLLILMASTVALLALWVVALRPKPVPVQDTPLAATREISKAQQAVAKSAAANAKLQAASGGSAAGAAAPAQAAAKPAAAAPKSVASAAKPAAATRTAGQRRDAAVVRDLKRGKIVVLLFWNPAAADDVAARGALRELDLHGGKVVVRVVPISRVAQYASVTSGVKITQSPTTLVIGREGHARASVGLTDPHEISQTVGDARAGR